MRPWSENTRLWLFILTAIVMAIFVIKAWKQDGFDPPGCPGAGKVALGGKLLDGSRMQYCVWRVRNNQPESAIR